MKETKDYDSDAAAFTTGLMVVTGIVLAVPAIAGLIVISSLTLLGKGCYMIGSLFNKKK